MTITQAPQRGEHVRPRGEDVKSGDPLLHEGTILGPREAMILAAAGHARIKARPRPRIVVLSTGSELREPGSALGFDSIFDCNSFGLALRPLARQTPSRTASASSATTRRS